MRVGANSIEYVAGILVAMNKLNVTPVDNCVVVLQGIARRAVEQQMEHYAD